MPSFTFFDSVTAYAYSREDGVWYLTLFFILSMTIVMHVGHRVDRTGPNALRVLLPVFTLVLVVFYASGTFRVFGQVKDILRGDSTSLQTAAGIAKVCRELQSVAQQQYYQFLLCITTLYLGLQTFCIPGTVVLNAAVGAVLGTLLGVPYCTALGTAGAVSCFLFSRAVGTSLVEAVDMRMMRGKGLLRIRGQVSRYRRDLFVYLLFLRLTPILPNWLVNLASPIVGVPLFTFASATMLGIMPQTYLAVRFGSLAHFGKPGETRRIVTWWDTLLLVVLACSILTGFRLKRRFEVPRGQEGDAGPAGGASDDPPAHHGSGAVRVPPPAQRR